MIVGKRKERLLISNFPSPRLERWCQSPVPGTVRRTRDHVSEARRHPRLKIHFPSVGSRQEASGDTPHFAYIPVVYRNRGYA